jgi:hypothetical protein
LDDLQGGTGGAGASGGSAGQAGGGSGGSAGVGGAGAGGGGTAGAAGSGGSAGVVSGHTVSGFVSIVNGGSAPSTSVILAPLAFDPAMPTLLPPSGPKASNVTDDWSIPNVPDGSYRVLVAFENDGLVVSPDTSISNPSTPTVVVAGEDVALPDIVKVTGALKVVSPDQGEKVSNQFNFAWTDDSGEDHYELRVIAPNGTTVWEVLDVPGVSGASTVGVEYTGPTLFSNTMYQFRVTSIQQGGVPITRTEDLRGQFVTP